ncbi:ATP-binding protein [Pseudarthrobacter albicanus]|uniref:ATP-binding protein n=1 Tax=Pseudarthrobacter albicanus TaxID=2823873 RepID=UPI001BABEBAC|nr:sensor histidine kinase [Pseudarthrobacter albicanus]
MWSAPGRTRTLTGQILIWVLSILVLTVTMGGVLFTLISNQSLDRQYRLRALGIAATVSQMPQIGAALQAGDPQHTIERLAAGVIDAAQPAYVVVTDRTGTRYSHPNAALIGQQLEEPVAVLDGQTHLGVNAGSLGISANAKVPVRAADGSIIGQVSVGILETTEQSDQVQEVWLIVGFSAAVLSLSVLGSLLLARRIKRVTFDLEPAEIASLLQEREALLHGIREAVIGLDDDGLVTVINEEARRLLTAEGAVVGRPLTDLVPAGRLRDLLTGAVPGADQVALTEDSLLVVNRMPVVLSGRSIGSVVTLRDRTETETLIRDLHSVQGLMDAMRALEHEYANRLHVVASLLEMGDHSQARNYVSQISDTSRSLGEGLRGRIAPPELAALLMAKITVAAEQDVLISVTDDSRLEQATASPQSLLTIVGNLLDNAVDALANTPVPRLVTIQFDDADGVFIAVRDNGPGVPAHNIDQVLVDGYSTKEARPGMRRGIGLALVSRIVRRAAGTLDVFPGPGGHFEVWIPADPQASGPNDEDTQ